MTRIIIDEQLGKKPTIKGVEADDFRKAIQADLELAKEKGWEVYIPPEWVDEAESNNFTTEDLIKDYPELKFDE